jgi:hypothetical protein
MIDFLFHTFWGGVLATEIVHAVCIVVFLRLAKGAESRGKRGARVEPRFDNPPTRKIPDVARDGKVVSLAVWRVKKQRGRDWPGPLVA